jgi:hypothetical protein
MEDQLIVNVEKEESKSSVAINPRYVLSIRLKLDINILYDTRISLFE